MKVHELKIETRNLGAVQALVKRFEIRKNDRDYQAGDILILKEWDGQNFTGSWIKCYVTHMYTDTSFGMCPDYVILSIHVLSTGHDNMEFVQL